jgi:tetratricopeptide (TPR) repeat protein
VPPAEVWRCYAEHLPPTADIVEVADRAYGRGLLQFAEGLLRRASGDSPTARTRLARLLEKQERWLEMLTVLRQAVAASDDRACHNLATLLLRFGRDAEDLDLLRLGADRGEEESSLLLAEKSEQAGELGEAERVLRKAAEASTEDAVTALGFFLERREMLDDATQCFVYAANRYRKLDQLFEFLERTGREAEATALRAQLAQVNEAPSRIDLEAVPEVFHYAGIDGDGLPSGKWTKEGTGLTRDASLLIFRFRPPGQVLDGIYGCPLLTGISVSIGELGERDDGTPFIVETVRQVYLSPDVKDLLASAESTDTAIEMVRALPQQNPWTRNCLARMLAHKGDYAGAVKLAREAFDRGDIYAGNLLGFIYESAGDRAAATRAWALVVLTSGGFEAQTRFGKLIEDDVEASANYAKYGLTVDAEVAQPWPLVARADLEIGKLARSYSAAERDEQRTALAAAAQEQLNAIWEWYESLRDDSHPLDFVYSTRGVANAQRTWHLIDDFWTTSFALISMLREQYATVPGYCHDCYVFLIQEVIKHFLEGGTIGPVANLVPDLRAVLSAPRLVVDVRRRFVETLFVIGVVGVQEGRHAEALEALNAAVAGSGAALRRRDDRLAGLRARVLAVRFDALAGLDLSDDDAQAADCREIVELVDGLTDPDERAGCTGARCVALMFGAQLTDDVDQAAQLLARCRDDLTSLLSTSAEPGLRLLFTQATVLHAGIMVEMEDLTAAQELLSEAQRTAEGLDIEVPSLQDLTEDA